MTEDIDSHAVSRGFFKDAQQPELGMIDNVHAVAALERAFGLLVSRRKNAIAIPLSEREARGLFGRSLRGREGDFWLAVARANPEGGLFVLFEGNGPTAHADALQALHDRYLHPAH